MYALRISSVTVRVSTSIRARMSGLSLTISTLFNRSPKSVEIDLTSDGFNASEPPAAYCLRIPSSCSIWSFGNRAPICSFWTLYPCKASSITSVRRSTSSNKFSQNGHKGISSRMLIRRWLPSLIESRICCPEASLFC